METLRDSETILERQLFGRGYAINEWGAITYEGEEPDDFNDDYPDEDFPEPDDEDFDDNGEPFDGSN